MADQDRTIPTQRRSLAMTIDETCEKLAECPPIPGGSQRNTLTGGFIVIFGDGINTQQERWRMNADGSVREYTRAKLVAARQPGKCPLDKVWWAE